MSELPENLRSVFKAYVGVELPLDENVVSFPARGLQQPKLRTYQLTDVSHPSVVALTQAAKEVGKDIRFVMPQEENAVSLDNPDRVNVYVEREGFDQPWYVQDSFKLG